MTWESYLFEFLMASLARPLWLAAAAWLLLRLLRIRHPASRHRVWTTVLIGMLLLPEASMMAPHWRLPVIPPSQHSASHEGDAIGFVSEDFPPTGSVAQPASRTSQRVSRAAASSLPTIETSIVWCYFAGVFTIALYRLIGWTLLRRVVSRSRTVRGRRVMESADLATPVTAGVLRPAVILPVGWREWSAATKRAVRAHEFEHLRRRDTLVAALTRLAQSVFWFHPMTWWLARKLRDLAELACDAAALERHDDPAGYSRILLDFAAAVNHIGQRTAWPGLAMASNSNMGRRIDELFELSGGTMRKLSRPVLLFALVGAPILCLAATVGLSERALQPKVKAVMDRVKYSEPTHPSTPPEAAAFAEKPHVPPRTVAEQNAPSRIPPAQTPPQAPALAKPTFEVAAIKRCKGDEGGGRGGRGGGGAGSPGTLTIRCQTLEMVIRNAYLQFPNGEPRARDPRNGRLLETISHRALTQPIKGGPGWLGSDRYTIEAKAEGEPSVEMLRGPMMQRLLEERLGLKIHREAKDVDVFNLVVAKGGPKLETAKEECIGEQEFFANGPPPMPPPNSGQMPPLICGAFLHTAKGEDISRRETITGLATELSRMLDRDVIDKTGIAGVFDIRMQLTAADLFHGLSFGPNGPPVDTTPDPSEPAGASVFAALQKLGLRLEAAKASSDFLVIDRVDRPSEN